MLTLVEKVPAAVLALLTVHFPLESVVHDPIPEKLTPAFWTAVLDESRMVACMTSAALPLASWLLVMTCALE
ncbi:hypothetical protein [Xylophilus sp. GOD-11R]|uniref:hypothetical protein n=1 Tax=Xylophilus sp. GOD-11R TaxID=3089814 RepID=UPI00298D5D89|nr:hypothetical protein [Xylophilus sp. GOD-11R]WPB56144.1 hypothetical protein R9X41_18645 [Xylophilus sp. GOD-11R]WPB56497.1 hypothetical protein R9X41_20500 [Xylophilus sp. GOD-11R]